MVTVQLALINIDSTENWHRGSPGSHYRYTHIHTFSRAFIESKSRKIGNFWCTPQRQANDLIERLRGVDKVACSLVGWNESIFLVGRKIVNITESRTAKVWRRKLGSNFSGNIRDLAMQKLFIMIPRKSGEMICFSAISGSRPQTTNCCLLYWANDLAGYCGTFDDWNIPLTFNALKEIN